MWHRHTLYPLKLFHNDLYMNIMPSVDRKFPNIASRSFFSPHAYCWLLVPFSGKLQTFVIWGFSWRKLLRITLWCRRQKMPLPPTLQRKISQIATKPREFSPSKVSHYTGCLSSSQPQNHAGLLPCYTLLSTMLKHAFLLSLCFHWCWKFFVRPTRELWVFLERLVWHRNAQRRLQEYACTRSMQQSVGTKVEYRMLLKQPVLESTAHELKKLYLLSKLQTLNPQSTYFAEIHRIYSSKLYYFTCSPHGEGD